MSKLQIYASWDYFCQQYLLSQWCMYIIQNKTLQLNKETYYCCLSTSKPNIENHQLRRINPTREVFVLVSTRPLSVVFGRLEAWQFNVLCSSNFCLLIYCKYNFWSWVWVLKSSGVVTKIKQKNKTKRQTTHCKSYGHIIHVISNSQSTFLLNQFA